MTWVCPHSLLRMCGSSSLLSITTVPSAVCMWKCSGRPVEQPVPCELERIDSVCLQHCDRTTLLLAMCMQSGSGRPAERPANLRGLTLCVCSIVIEPLYPQLCACKAAVADQCPVNMMDWLWLLGVCSIAIEPLYPQLCACKAAVADQWNDQCPVNMMDWLWLLCVCSIAIEPLYPQLCACKAAVVDQWNDQCPVNMMDWLWLLCVCSIAIEPLYPQLCACKAAVADQWNDQCPVNMMDWLWLLCVCSIAIEPLYPQLCACKAAVADQWNDQSPSPTELASRLLAVPCSLAFQREDNVSILQLIAEVLRPVFLSWGGGLGVLSYTVTRFFFLHCYSGGDRRDCVL